jgi:hypothetical protein
MPEFLKFQLTLLCPSTRMATNTLIKIKTVTTPHIQKNITAKISKKKLLISKKTFLFTVFVQLAFPPF